MENVWTQHAKRSSNPKSLLVLDSFSAYKTDVVKHQFYEKNTDLAIISDGLTSRLQLLDVSLNKSFKAKVFYFILFYYLNKVNLSFCLFKININVFNKIDAATL